MHLLWYTIHITNIRVYLFSDIPLHGIKYASTFNNMVCMQLEVNIIKHVVIIHNVMIKSLCTNNIYICNYTELASTMPLALCIPLLSPQIQN